MVIELDQSARESATSRMVPQLNGRASDFKPDFQFLDTNY